jgi:hypothetical protein
MQLHLIRTDPVQEIAAEPATLELLITALDEATQPRLSSPELITACRSGLGWPLVPDESICPGAVHLRPVPRPSEWHSGTAPADSPQQ